MESVAEFAAGGAGLGQRHPQVSSESRIPVAWLEGEVLAEYVKFLEEAAAAPAAAHPGSVEWMEAQAREEFSRFLADVEEFVGPGYGRVRAQDGGIMDEDFAMVMDNGGGGYIEDDVYGPVLQEGLHQAFGSDDNDFHMGDYGGGGGDPVDEVMWFIEATMGDQAPEHAGIDDCGSCVVDGDGGGSLIEDEELEMLVPHVLDLPAFRAREAAAAAQQKTEPSSPRQGSGWMHFFS